MAARKIVKGNQQLRAKLVSAKDKTLPCIFCKREVDDELIYGKIYAIGNVQCHYFCALLSCCLIQKGRDEEGLFGFLYRDILAEVERCKKHKCSYCNQFGANLGCTVSQCRTQFHLPCGREKNAVTMFYGNYKSYCQKHAPKQQISEHIMLKARQRMPKRKKKNTNDTGNEVLVLERETIKCEESVCVICYEFVDTYPTINTFWPPCCGKDAWFHRTCLQRMALSAGMHYLKCPLCNDKEIFYQAVLEQGYYVPDRDAAWELEQNAFQEIYSRVLTCSVDCKCPHGREYDSDNGAWDIMPCGLCGSICAHLYCFSSGETQDVKPDAMFVCDTCRVAAGEQLDQLLESVQKLIIQEQAKSSAANPEHRRVMPCRMSLRRTKQGAAPQPSTSRNSIPTAIIEAKPQNSIPPTNTTSSRQELNLPTPKRKSIFHQIPMTSIENNLLSPLKLLEQGLIERMGSMNIRDDITLNSSFVLSIMRQKFAKPKPLSEKRRIINDILEGLLKNQLKESPKSKNTPREWTTPQKRPEQLIDTQITPEKPNTELFKTPSKSSKKKDIQMKQEVSPKETPAIPNTILRNLLTEIDNRKHSHLELLFDKANTLINREHCKMNIKPIKSEIIDNESDDNVANNQTVKIGNTEGNKNIKDITKIDLNNSKEDLDTKEPKWCADFNSFDKEKLWNRNFNLDLEMFKNSYLNEVGTCKFTHKDANNTIETQLQTAADLAKNAANNIVTDQPKNHLKRKANDKSNKKTKRKRFNSDKIKKTKKKHTKKLRNKRISISSDDSGHKSESNKKQKKKTTARLSIRDQNVKLKIKWKSQQLKVKISKQSDKSKKSKMTQYILQYGDDPKQVIAKPQVDETPNKRKYVKTNKSPDNLKQTSIQNFFTTKSPKK